VSVQTGRAEVETQHTQETARFWSVAGQIAQQVGGSWWSQALLALGGVGGFGAIVAKGVTVYNKLRDDKDQAVSVAQEAVAYGNEVTKVAEVSHPAVVAQIKTNAALRQTAAGVKDDIDELIDAHDELVATHTSPAPAA
jgi:hypothetical protein